MKRLIGNLLLMFMASTLLLGGYIWSNRTFIVSGHLSAILHLPVSIADLTLTPTQITLKGVKVHNVPGSRLPNAFKADRIVIRFHPLDLLAPVVTLKEVHIQQPILGIEMYESGGSDNNWERILNRMVTKSEDRPPKHRFEISHLIASHIRIQAYNRALSKKILEPRPIPKFEAHNIGTDNPLKKDELVAVVTQAIMKEAVQLPGMRNILDDVQRLPSNVFKGIFSLPILPQKSG